MRKPWDPVAPENWPKEERNGWLNMSSVELKKIKDDECRKILSLSGSKLFKYAEHVTSSSPINRSFGFYYFLLCRLKSKQRHDNSGAEAMVKTLKSILLCLRSRLLDIIHCTTQVSSYNFSGMGKYEGHIKQGWHGNFEGNYVRGHHHFGGRFSNEQLRVSF